MMRLPVLPCFLVFLAAFLVAGCETVVEVDLPAHESRLVVNALYEAGRPAQVYVSHSVGSLSAGDPTPVIDATVELVSDGIPSQRAILAPGEGFYQTPGVLEAGRTYTLRVSAPGLDPVEATAATPPVLPVSVAMERLDETEQLDDPSMTILERPVYRYTLHLEDPPNERNYYRLHLLLRFTEGGEVVSFPIVFRTHDPSIAADNQDMELEGGEVGFEGGEAYFSDLLFDGKNHELTFETWIPFYDDPLQPDRNERIEVILEHLDEGFYEYRRTLDLQNDTGDNPFAEPVNVYANIENGYGIFAGATPMVFPFEIE